MIHRFEDEGALNREISVGPWRARSCRWFGMTPSCDRVFVEPDGEAAPVDQRTIVCTPIANTVSENVQQRPCDLKTCPTKGLARTGTFVIASVWLYQVLFLDNHRHHRPVAHIKEILDEGRWRIAA